MGQRCKTKRANYNGIMKTTNSGGGGQKIYVYWAMINNDIMIRSTRPKASSWETSRMKGREKTNKHKQRCRENVLPNSADVPGDVSCDNYLLLKIWLWRTRHMVYGNARGAFVPLKNGRGDSSPWQMRTKNKEEGQCSYAPKLNAEWRSKWFR